MSHLLWRFSSDSHFSASAPVTTVNRHSCFFRVIALIYRKAFTLTRSQRTVWECPSKKPRCSFWTGNHKIAPNIIHTLNMVCQKIIHIYSALDRIWTLSGSGAFFFPNMQKIGRVSSRGREKMGSVRWLNVTDSQPLSANPSRQYYQAYYKTPPFFFFIKGLCGLITTSTFGCCSTAKESCITKQSSVQV